MTTTDNLKPMHLGRNVKRLREILKIKQEVLADRLGPEWNQKKISILESKEMIEPELLEELAKAMKVSVEAIKTYSEEATVSYVQNNYEGSNNQGDLGPNYHNCSIDVVDKRLEDLEGKIEQLMKMMEKK